MSSSASAERTLGRRIASGAGWSALARFSIQLSVIAASTVVARRVAPSAYGVLGMALLVTGLVSLFRDLGTSAAIIQKRDLSDDLLSSVFWLNLTIGFVAGGVCFLSAPYAGAFFRDGAIVPVLRALSSSFVISSFANVHSALLNREMAFKKLSLIEIFSSFARIGVVVTLACLHAGVWSFVASTLVETLLSSALLCFCCKWRPSLSFSWSSVREIMSFGLNLSAFNIFNYFARNADNTIVGRFLGSSALGFYQLGYNMMMFPVLGVAQLLTRVLFPALSEIQDDHERFRHVYLRACTTIALVTFPLMAGATVLSGPLIRTVYGNKWIDVIPVLAVLAPVGLIQSITTTTGQIYTAKGRADLMFRVGSVCAVLFVISFFAGLPWGIRGVASSYAICTFVLALPILKLSFRLIELRLRDLWHALQPVVAATALMTLIVFSARTAVVHRKPMPSLVDLLLFTCLGALVYLPAVYLQHLPELHAVIGLWPEYLAKRGTRPQEGPSGNDENANISVMNTGSSAAYNPE